MAGVIPSTEFNEQIKRVVRQTLREQRGEGQGASGRPERGLPWQWAITNAAIPAASSGLTSPGSGEVELLSMDSEQDLSRSGATFTGANRSESVSIAAHTLVIVARFRGERIIVWSDCAALANPPA